VTCDNNALLACNIPSLYGTVATIDALFLAAAISGLVLAVLMVRTRWRIDWNLQPDSRPNRGAVWGLTLKEWAITAAVVANVSFFVSITSSLINTTPIVYAALVSISNIFMYAAIILYLYSVISPLSTIEKRLRGLARYLWVLMVMPAIIFAARMYRGVLSTRLHNTQPSDPSFDTLVKEQSLALIAYNVVYLSAAVAVVIYVAAARALFTRTAILRPPPAILKSGGEIKLGQPVSLNNPVDQPQSPYNATQLEDPFLNSAPRANVVPSSYPPLYPTQSSDVHRYNHSVGRVTTLLSATTPAAFVPNTGASPGYDYSSLEVKDQPIKIGALRAARVCDNNALLSCASKLPALYSLATAVDALYAATALSGLVLTTVMVWVRIRVARKIAPSTPQSSQSFTSLWGMTPMEWAVISAALSAFVSASNFFMYSAISLYLYSIFFPLASVQEALKSLAQYLWTLMVLPIILNAVRMFRAAITAQVQALNTTDPSYDALARSENTASIIYNVTFLMAAAAVVIYISTARVRFTRCMREIIGPTVLANRRLQENRQMSFIAPGTSVPALERHTVEFVSGKTALSAGVGYPGRTATHTRMPSDPMQFPKNSGVSNGLNGATQLAAVSPHQRLLGVSQASEDPHDFFHPPAAVSRPGSAVPNIGFDTVYRQAHMRSASLPSSDPIRPPSADGLMGNSLQRNFAAAVSYPPIYPAHSPADEHTFAYSAGRATALLASSPTPFTDRSETTRQSSSDGLTLGDHTEARFRVGALRNARGMMTWIIVLFAITMSLSVSFVIGASLIRYSTALAFVLNTLSSWVAYICILIGFVVAYFLEGMRCWREMRRVGRRQ
ncbi:hypothetical protein HK405_004038, partial [Cladochytrium tenue]